MKIEGAYIIEPDLHIDHRGFFARSFCADLFEKNCLESKFVQANVSMSRHKGTLRGLHYQLPPFQEVKLVRCTQGIIYDLILDIRVNSKTFGQSQGVILSRENRQQVYVPEGCAHGFLTLEDDVEVTYMVSSPYSQENERGIRYNDPHFNIEWPEKPTYLSTRDTSHPLFKEVV